MASQGTASYANPFTVKLPLLRVAHATDAEHQQQLNQVRSNLQEQAKSNMNVVADSGDDSLSRDISSKGIPSADARQQRQQPSGNPLLFDFEHYHDPELTPRQKWQQKTVILDAQLAEERQKYQELTKENARMKAQLEKELLALSSKLREQDSQNQTLTGQLQQETRLKEEYHMQFKRA